jgi:hypothetical protein
MTLHNLNLEYWLLKKEIHLIFNISALKGLKVGNILDHQVLNGVPEGFSLMMFSSKINAVGLRLDKNCFFQI